MGYVKELSVDLGPRESATDQELRAAEYLVSRFQGFGYETRLQPFSWGSLSRESSSLFLNESNAEKVEVIPLTGSKTGTASGVLVAAGLGKAEDIPEGGWMGKSLWWKGGLSRFGTK